MESTVVYYTEFLVQGGPTGFFPHNSGRHRFIMLSHIVLLSSDRCTDI